MIDELEYAKVYQKVIDAYQCRHCLAKAGDWCRTPRGSPKSRYHQIRWDQLFIKGVEVALAGGAS